jgi:MerR family mercuric resistance operon transcriptional regulator
MASKSPTIGTVAAQVGVNVQTIRYYQRRRLLSVPPLPPGGIRRYPEDAVQRVRFIKRAQQLGFTLEEVKSLLQLNDGRHCAETRIVAERKFQHLERKIADLKAMQKSLSTLIKACRRPGSKSGCPIIEALDA